ncbi:hypothetical protein BW730_14240 [Tessaracoccus aquimaris]|uniref:YobI-like P-loop NTPase domain-containing protein n=2 Tax=Tessaracoccus aquimaris TaxID=1332264 RepID=A0A1Q2CR03_9ACTN|nr:hypothetical protein BW730_14240 [Tessaracoccus aquimaris]
MPLSRYRRLSHLKRWRLIRQSVVAALVGAAVMAAISFGGTVQTGWRIALGALGATLLWGVYRTRLSSRLSWSELRAGNGPGSLTLTNNSSWFDEYLDEIVYFFDSSGCRLVIFEDLDRFKDPQIFEMLRELNTLLNNAGQLKRKSQQPIRFLCAVRDSVFGTGGGAQPADAEASAKAIEPEGHWGMLIPKLLAESSSLISSCRWSPSCLPAPHTASSVNCFKTIRRNPQREF